MPHDPRYLRGIDHFNRGEYFEAHEVWEDLWIEVNDDRKGFYHGLIQAAVALYHFGNGNVRGAVKLFVTSRKYMESAGSPFWGLDADAFWLGMERCFAELHASSEPNPAVELDDELVPEIRLEPEPAEWPDPAGFVDEEE